MVTGRFLGLFILHITPTSFLSDLVEDFMLFPFVVLNDKSYNQVSKVVKNLASIYLPLRLELALKVP